MNIKEILFWIFLIISVILVFWYILGNTPNEFIAIIKISYPIYYDPYLSIQTVSIKQGNRDIYSWDILEEEKSVSGSVKTYSKKVLIDPQIILENTSIGSKATSTLVVEYDFMKKRNSKTKDFTMEVVRDT